MALIQIMLIVSAVNTKSSFKYNEKADRAYVLALMPDLTARQKGTVGDLWVAYRRKDSCPVEYENAAVRFFALYRAFYNRLREEKVLSERIKSLSGLCQLERFLTFSFSIREVKSRINISDNKTADLKQVKIDEIFRNMPIEIAPQQLPAEIRRILEAGACKDGRTVFKYVEDNVSTIIFVPGMNMLGNIFKPENDGTAIMVPKVVIIELRNSPTNSTQNRIFIARTLIHEAKHNEMYHDQKTPATILANTSSRERFAYEKAVEFLISCMDSQKLSEEEKAAARIDLRVNEAMLTK